jgi:alkylhydroperoxidase family enzyme
LVTGLDCSGHYPATGLPGLPSETIGLVTLRASQISGCGFCVDMHAHVPTRQVAGGPTS